MAQLRIAQPPNIPVMKWCPEIRRTIVLQFNDNGDRKQVAGWGETMFKRIIDQDGVTRL